MFSNLIEHLHLLFSSPSFYTAVQCEMVSRWCFILMLLYGIPTITFYMMIIIKFNTPTTKDFFRGTFFKLSTVLGIVDFVSYIDSYPYIRMPLCISFAKMYWNAVPGYSINIIIFIFYYLSYVRQYLIVANAANRCTVLFFPQKHDFVSFKFTLKIISTMTP